MIRLILILIIIPTIASAQKQSGIASFYANKFVGRPTASGEKYNHTKLTAAHKTLPFGTQVKVTNDENGKSVIVRINDRGPFVKNRIIDLSRSAASHLDFIAQGTAQVTLEIVDFDALEPIENHVEAKGAIKLDLQKYYDHKMREVSREGYGVQVGSFGKMENLNEAIALIRQKHPSREVTIKLKLMNDQDIYALIIGEYPSRKKAESHKDRLIATYPGCFIVEF